MLLPFYVKVNVSERDMLDPVIDHRKFTRKPKSMSVPRPFRFVGKKRYSLWE